MTNALMNRMGIQPSTNKSGGAVTYGAVVIAGSATAKSFTTTTTEGYKSSLIGVVVEPGGIANNSTGLVSWGLWAPKINLDASAALYDFIKTDGVAGQGTPHAAPMQSGDFALALETGTTPSVLLIGAPEQGAESDYASILSSTYDYIAANNADPIDTKITKGSYISLIYFSSQNAAAWKDATNAIHTVTASTVLIPLFVSPSMKLPSDSASRRARLYNTSDSLDVVAYTDFSQGFIPWEGDGATASKVPEVAAGKTVKLQIWNVDTTKRAAGGFVICKEV